jgi:hypothetical protein
VSYARIRKIKHNEKEKKDEISMKIFNINGSARVHIMTSNFIHSSALMNFNEVKNVLENSIVSERFKLSEWKNAYLSNRRLGDEFRYVFDRKYLKRFTGNSLEKPQILLKRLKIRETNFEEEAVGLGDNYESIDIHNSYTGNYNGDSVQAPIRQNPNVQNNYPYDGNQKQQRFRPPQQTLRSSKGGFAPGHHKSNEDEQFKSFINFLKHPGLVKANLIPDKNGNLQFTVPSGKFSNLYVLISDDENVTDLHIQLPSQTQDIKCRNLSLNKPLDPKKTYNQVRNVINLKEGDRHKIKDITSVDYIIIDSLEKTKNIQLEIARMDGYEIRPDLLFLTTWDKLSYEEQIKKYTSYLCHETHVFLYFRDRPFFEKVIRPFITNKSEKSFIDHWLLENYEEIKKYTGVEFFDNLNSVEKILLISLIVHKDEGKLPQLIFRNCQTSQRQNQA